MKPINPIKLFITIIVFAILIEITGASVTNVKHKIGNFSFGDIKIEKFLNN